MVSVMDEVQSKSAHDILVDIGSTLVAERERQGLALATISQRLRILEEHLGYIETGDVKRLPAMTYVIGYIRSYARLLGLDDAKLCADLKASLDPSEDKPEYTFIEDKLDKKTSAGRWALAVLIVSLVAYGGWYAFSILSVPTTTVEQAAVQSEYVETLPQDDTPAPAPAPESAVQNVPDARMVIEATASSWIEVTRPDGTVVASRLMRLGDTYLVPEDEELYLTTGNAGGLTIRLAGQDPFTLGAWGAVIRDIPLKEVGTFSQ